MGRGGRRGGQGYPRRGGDGAGSAAAGGAQGGAAAAAGAGTVCARRFSGGGGEGPLPCRPCRAGGSPAGRRGPRPSRARRGPGCSSPWAGCTGCCGRVTTRSGWAPGRRCTWRPCWSTSRPRSWSWRATRPATTRRRASSRGTCSWLSATTRSSTSCWAA